ncbi:hypothetical protein ACFQXA_11545 [Nocardiopsis composta]
MGGAWAARLPPAGFRRSAADAVPGGLEQVCIAVMMLTPAAAALLVLARVHRVPGVPRAVGPARPGRSTACWAAACPPSRCRSCSARPPWSWPTWPASTAST